MPGKRVKVLMTIAAIAVVIFGLWLVRDVRERHEAAERELNYQTVGAGWDGLVKIGEKSAPWFCSENNVHVAFEFNPKSKGELADTNGSDILKRVSVFCQLDGCL